MDAHEQPASTKPDPAAPRSTDPGPAALRDPKDDTEDGRPAPSRVVRTTATLVVVLLPLLVGAFAFAKMAGTDPSKTEAQTALNAIGATLVLIAAVILLADVAYRLMKPSHGLLLWLDVALASLASWGAAFLALGVVDEKHFDQVAAWALGGILVLIVVMFLTKDALDA